MLNQWIAADQMCPDAYISVLGHVTANGLVFGDEDSMIDIVYHDGEDWMQPIDRNEAKSVAVSHWMPLPNPPINPADLANEAAN